MDTKQKTYYTYMLRCADGSIYSGYTDDLGRRLSAHNSGRGAKYTRSRLPVSLAYFECFESKRDAMRREREFKSLSHIQKERLASNAEFSRSVEQALISLPI